MRRILPVLLGLVLCVVPASLQAQFGYLTNTGGTTVTITNYTGTNTVVVIPTTNLDGLVVTGIAANAFKKLTNITSITFPDTLTSIGSDAFRENDLTNVLIPAGVTNIGEVPFYQCASLTNIMVDTNNLFYSSLNGVLFDKNLTDIIQYPSGLGGSYALPGTVTNIGSLVFSDNTNLTSVTIPPSVTVIGDEAFLQCYYLTNVCFEGNSSTNFDPGAFEEDDLTNVFYVTGATGWGTTYANVQTNLPGVLPATPCAECAGFAPGPVGSLLVTITPSNAISAGAQWLVDGGLGNGSGATVANLSAGSHIVSYEPIFGWITPSNQVVTIASNTLTITNGVYSIATSSGALSVVMLPSAISPEAQWQVTGTNDGMVVAVSNLASGATTNLAAGNYEISFTTVSGWITPSNQTVTITTGVTTSASGIYTASNSPSNLVIFLTNGYGTFKPPATLTPGGKYKLTAVPKPKNIFAGWIGGTNQPYSLLSYSTTYTFTNELNLVLEANFETNVFLAAEGAYRGLFGPANESDRQQTNSGSFSMNVTSTGSCSGTLDLGGQNISFSGKLNPDGLAGITTKAIRSVPALDMTLQLDFADQSVSGTISNSDGSLTAVLNGYRAVFGGTEKATAFLGRYTLVVPGVSDSTVGPFGDGYGTVTVSSAGAVALAGSLADGTSISQSSMISQDGFWPLYVSLYGGKGSLWGWNNFAADSLSSAPSLSWINSTNASKLASYRAGFTNQQVTLRGSLYSPNLPFPSGLAETLGVGGLADITNKLTLKTNKATGIISGSFANPSNPKQTIKVNGVILQLPGQTNAEGYFLETNESGSFTIGPALEE